jgi:hypothetical protein
MKKLLLIFFGLLYSPGAYAAIDEYKIDIYFANGILTTPEEAFDNSEYVLKPAIIEKFGINYYNQNIGKVDYAYNHTQGFLTDGIETFLQKFGWQALADAFIPTHASDLQKQVDAYKESIAQGHKVLAVAHSQGNLFTFEAYEALPVWMRGYFEAISVASPMSTEQVLFMTIC